MGTKGKSKYTGKFNNGHSFGSWVVVDGIIHGSPAKMDVRCVCGKIRRANVYTLVSGQSTSCGCVRVGEKAPNWKGVKGAQGISRQTLYNNARPAVSYLSYEDMVSLFNNQNATCALTSTSIDLDSAKLIPLDASKPYSVTNAVYVSPTAYTVTAHNGLINTSNSLRSMAQTSNIFEQMGMKSVKEKL